MHGFPPSRSGASDSGRSRVRGTRCAACHGRPRGSAGFGGVVATRPKQQPKLGAFEVKNIFSDFKRHDLGKNFHERNYDGTTQTEFLTTALWGVGSTPPYGHDGRSINLTEVILRHGGEAVEEASRFEKLGDILRGTVLEFLNSLIIFPPDDTASNLNPGNRADPNFPQSGHGGIRLPVLFNDPTDLE